MTLPLSLLTANRELILLHGAISVDNGTDRGRFLEAAADTFKGASMHDSVAAAFDHLAREEEATIVGHGIDGFMAAGTGAKLRHFEGQHLCVKHAAEWGAVIDNLADRRVKRLTLFGCSIGAGTSGEALVTALSARLKATVRAPLGDVWIDDITRRPFTTKDGGGWRIATDGKPESQPLTAHPAPIPLDSISRSRRPHGSDLLVFEDKRFLGLPVAALQSLTWRPEEEGPERSWHGEAARSAVANVAFNAPLVVGGVPASFVTGNLWITFRWLRQDRTRQFRIHNDRLLEDLEVPRVFYRINMPALLETAR